MPRNPSDELTAIETEGQEEAIEVTVQQMTQAYVSHAETIAKRMGADLSITDEQRARMEKGVRDMLASAS